MDGLTTTGMTLAIEQGSDPDSTAVRPTSAPDDGQHAFDDYESFNLRPRGPQVDQPRPWESQTQRFEVQRAKDLKALLMILGGLLGVATLFLLILSIAL